MTRALRIVVCACAAACVPRGDPPAGRQLVADRTTSLAGLVRPNGDGVARVLITRPTPGAQSQQAVDLYVVSADAGAPPVERLLASGVAASSAGGCTLGPTESFCSDARGRLFVAADYDPLTGFTALARIDPITGERQDLGPGGASPILSTSGERLLVLVYRDALPTTATLYEPDGRVIPLEGVTSGLFVGEDLYYATTEMQLLRLTPGGAPELLATGIAFFGPTAITPEGHVLLMLNRPGADRTTFTVSFLDTATLEETPAPVSSANAVRLETSPDGRWLLTFDFAAGRATFTERTTGVQDVFDVPGVQGGDYVWRPEHDEVWFANGGYPEPKIWIKKPGGPALEISGLAYGFLDDRGGGSIFTRDGAYWFSSRAPLSERPVIQVGSADDPAGVRFDLAPAGTTTDSYWRLADGRILTPAYVKVGKRKDLYAVDPATGESRLLGEAGLVLAVGQTRLLANLHVNDSRGDLTAVDLATGQATVLAAEFTMEAIAERTGTDAVAPGAHVAYRFQARFVSPYDGIWVATLP